ncbi:MAG: hypothetical protein KDH84_09965 [Calditrichaeota bacterium]|nr:hypothetical protein [Calditrichota bacterium]
MKNYVWVILAAGLAMFWSCEENTLDSVTTDGGTGQIVVDTLYATYDSTYASAIRPSTLGVNQLQLGRRGGYKFRPIMRFFGLPEEPIELLSARIEFAVTGSSGSPTELTARAHPIIDNWLTDTSRVWQDADGNIDDNITLGEMQILFQNNSSDLAPTQQLVFNQTGLETVSAWADTTDSTNYGLAIDFNDADMDYILKLQARSIQTPDTLGPALIYRYIAQSAPSDTLVDTLVAITDAFLVRNDFQPTPQRLYTTPYANARVSLLKFDLQELISRYPDGIIIETANLQLPIDWANTIIDDSTGANLRLTAADSVDSDSIAINSAYAANINFTVDLRQISADNLFLEVPEGEERRQLALRYAQTLLNVPDAFDYFYIDDKQKDNYLSIYSFFTANAAAPASRPRIIITSLRLPDERL